MATSNIPPDELYRNGLQRARFLPAIDAIKQHCDIMNVDAGVDYRLRTLTRAHLWLSPLNAETTREMDKLWLALAGQNASTPRNSRLTIARCQRSALKTKRWRSPLRRCALMPAASTTTLRFHVCSTP